MAPTNLTRPMDSHELLSDLLAAASRRIDAAESLEELAEIESSTIGRGSQVAEMRRALGRAPAEERRELGKWINDSVTQVTAELSARRSALQAEIDAARLQSDRLDVTLPGRTPPRGTLHLVQETMNEIVDIFVSIGYTVATGPEAETEFYNFTALNIPATHPARFETDTLYLDYGDSPEEILLRTHTSPMQARYMEEHQPPVHVVVPGRVFRRDNVDATHTPIFHQVEGLAVDEGITFADLKGSLAYFAKEFFGTSIQVRFQPDHFPFTEPSAQMHALANGTWIELLGCGMVHPAVFEHVGYDPAEVTGFAFGMGADRMAMVRHGITDLRYMFDSDVRVLRQFL